MNSQNIMLIGFVLMLTGMLVIFGSVFYTALKGRSADSKYSVVGLIGFIPFGISNDKRLFVLTLGLAVVLVTLSLLFLFRFR